MAQANINKVNKAFNVKKLDEMLQHFKTYNFIKLVKGKAMQLGFLSDNLKEFIRREWLFANLVCSNQPAFLFSSVENKENIYDAFGNIKTMIGSVPFSIIEIEKNHSEETNTMLKSNNAVQLLSNQFKFQRGTILRNYTFCTPSNAEEYFYKIQKSRKIWWRKFSACPGRFINSTTNTKEGDKSVISEIQAEFPWGLETIESIKYSPGFGACDKDISGVKVTKHKKDITSVVTCETILEKMTLTYLCDSYENLNGNTERHFLRFNRKLAPFKVSVAGTGTSSEIIKNLEELSLLLTKQIQKLGFTVLFLPDACKTTIERQLLRNDALGVPFTLLLNDNTLKDGTVALRSRDTTLQEHSHVSIVVEYLQKMLN